MQYLHFFPTRRSSDVAEAKNVTPEFVRWGTRLACLEMLLSGVTTYTDMYYFEEIIAEATKEAGMRGVLGQTIRSEEHTSELQSPCNIVCCLLLVKTIS